MILLMHIHNSAHCQANLDEEMPVTAMEGTEPESSKEGFDYKSITGPSSSMGTTLYMLIIIAKIL